MNSRILAAVSHAAPVSGNRLKALPPPPLRHIHPYGDFPAESVPRARCLRQRCSPAQREHITW